MKILPCGAFYCFWFIKALSNPLYTTQYYTREHSGAFIAVIEIPDILTSSWWRP